MLGIFDPEGGHLAAQGPGPGPGGPWAQAQARAAPGRGGAGRTGHLPGSRSTLGPKSRPVSARAVGGGGRTGHLPGPGQLLGQSQLPGLGHRKFSHFFGDMGKIFDPSRGRPGGPFATGPVKSAQQMAPPPRPASVRPPICPGPGTGGGRPGGPADCPGHGQLWGQSPLPGLRQKKFCPGPGPAKRGVPVAGFF